MIAFGELNDIGNDLTVENFLPGEWLEANGINGDDFVKFLASQGVPKIVAPFFLTGFTFGWEAHRRYGE